MTDLAVIRQRLAVAVATGILPPDLGEMLLEILDRDRQRNEIIKRAAGMVPGSTWKRAEAVRDALRGRTTAPHAIRPLAREALRLDPACPTSVRQIFRILTAA